MRILRRAASALALLLAPLFLAPLPALAQQHEPAAARQATEPLKSLAELNRWTAATAPWNRATVPLRHRAPADNPLADLWLERGPEQNARGRVLVMHDMGAGYIADQDRYPAGTGNDRLYRFTAWQYADTFVYFSHSRVSFPPPGWTDSAHRNGVRSLGTFIIEDGKGNPEGQLRELLDNPRQRKHYATKLAAMARAYGFDGWLVNIETGMPGDAGQSADRARSLRDFVAELRNAVLKRNPQGQVIWYDSITRDGEVDYQNELNGRNEMFFAAADGITVNYDWSPPIRDGSPKHSARAAGKRSLDVFSAVDVYRRPEQLRAYREFNAYRGAKPAFAAGTSFGVFGPAWTYEGIADPAEFRTRDAHFWLGTAGEATPRGGMAEFIAARPVPSVLPFTTAFDQGFGAATYRNGAVASSAAWGNVGLIDVLPTWRDVQLPGSGAYAAGLTTDAAFNGGSSFRVAAGGTPAGYSLRPLFRTEFIGAAGLTVTVRENGLNAALVVVAANKRKPDRPPRLLLLLPPGRNTAPANVDYGLAGGTVPPVSLVPDAVDTVGGWSRRTYDLSRVLGGRAIGAIGLLAYPATGAPANASLLLGELTVR